MAKVDPSDESGVYIPAYLNRRTQVVSWDKPPASEQVPENGAEGEAAPAASPELEAAEAAASAAEAAAAADKAEGHRLLMAQAYLNLSACFLKMGDSLGHAQNTATRALQAAEESLPC